MAGRFKQNRRQAKAEALLRRTPCANGHGPPAVGKTGERTSSCVFCTRAAAALLIGASASAALVKPSLRPDLRMPPAGEGVAAVSAGPVIQSDEPPPPLPDYDQPPMPAFGYIWTPGYWAWNNDDYYWVPGVWVEPPQPGLLWTPAIGRSSAASTYFHRGYWAPHVGFYGGVNYGYGYNGLGYEGGRWENGRFYYNTTVNNFGCVRVEQRLQPAGDGSARGREGELQRRPWRQSAEADAGAGAVDDGAAHSGRPRLSSTSSERPA